MWSASVCTAFPIRIESLFERGSSVMAKRYSLSASVHHLRSKYRCPISVEISALAAAATGAIDAKRALNATGADDEQPRKRLRAAVETRGLDYVGQEVVRLSTAPVWHEGKLVPSTDLSVYSKFAGRLK